MAGDREYLHETGLRIYNARRKWKENVVTTARRKWKENVVTTKWLLTLPMSVTSANGPADQESPNKTIAEVTSDEEAYTTLKQRERSSSFSDELTMQELSKQHFSCILSLAYFFMLLDKLIIFI